MLICAYRLREVTFLPVNANKTKATKWTLQPSVIPWQIKGHNNIFLWSYCYCATKAFPYFPLTPFICYKFSNQFLQVFFCTGMLNISCITNSMYYKSEKGCSTNNYLHWKLFFNWAVKFCMQSVCIVLKVSKITFCKGIDI